MAQPPAPPPSESRKPRGVSVSDMKEALGPQTSKIEEALTRLVAQDSWEKPYADAARGELTWLVALLHDAAVRLDERRKVIEEKDAALVRARAAIQEDCADAYRRGYEAGERAWIDGYAEKPQ